MAEAHMNDDAKAGSGERIEPGSGGGDHTSRSGADAGGRGVDEAATDADAGAVVLDRRSLLAAAGVAAASVAGCAGTNEPSTVEPVSAFGFGGAPVIQQASTLSLSVSESEPNDTEGNAMEIDYGTTVTGRLTVSDSDWYAVELPSDDDTVVSFERAAPTGVTAVILYEPSGQFDNLRYVTTDQPVSFSPTVEASGTHYVQVVDTQDSAGTYKLLVGRGGTVTATPTETATPTATPTETATPTATSTATASETDYGTQGYGEYGYGGVSASN
jgi:hypothetical protein